MVVCSEHTITLLFNNTLKNPINAWPLFRFWAKKLSVGQYQPIRTNRSIFDWDTYMYYKFEKNEQTSNWVECHEVVEKKMNKSIAFFHVLRRFTAFLVHKANSKYLLRRGQRCQAWEAASIKDNFVSFLEKQQKKPKKILVHIWGRSWAAEGSGATPITPFFFPKWKKIPLCVLINKMKKFTLLGYYPWAHAYIIWNKSDI